MSHLKYNALPTPAKAYRMARMSRTYRYPPALRTLGLFGSMLAGGILLGSVLA